MSQSDDLLFRDGLGDRLLIRDNSGRPAQQCLLIRVELASVPAFEFSLNERLWLLEKFDHPSFLTVRDISRLLGRLPTIGLVHDLAVGPRLSEVLSKYESAGRSVSVGAAAFVLREILAGLADFHRQSGDMAHGALAPERIVLANGKVRIADYVFGAALEQLRFTNERYWKELRVAAPLTAGGARLDRRVDVAQAAMIFVALLVGRPLRDNEHLGGLSDLMLTLSVPQPVRSWLLKALHMDPRRTYVHAGEALRALDEALAEGGVVLAPKELDLEATRPEPAAAAPVRVAAPKPAAAPPAPPAKPALKPLAQPKAARDAWDAHDVDSRPTIQRAAEAPAEARVRPGRGLKKFLVLAAMLLLMTGAFTAAQFIPAPDWLFANSGTLVIDSNPQGFDVLINGTPQGSTPVTLELASGVHEVELRGPGKPRFFKVHITRGERIAQFIEFVRR